MLAFFASVSSLKAQCPDPVESNATFILTDETCAGSEDGSISVDFVTAAGIYEPILGDLDPAGGYRYALWDASIGNYVYDDIGIAPPTSPINPNISIEFNSPNNIVFRNLPPNSGTIGFGYFIIAERQDGNNCVQIYVPDPLGAVIGVGEPLPTAGLSGGGFVCLGDPLPDVVISFTGAVPYDFTYTLDGSPVSVTGHNSDTYTITAALPGTYALTVLSDGNGCNGTDLGGTVIVGNNPLPSPTITGPDVLCFDETGIYTTESGSGETNYIWDVIGGTIVSGGTITDPNIEIQWDGLGPYVVSVNYDNSLGCDAASPTSYGVTVNPLPVPVITGDDAVCFGDTETYTTASGSGETNYIWNVTGGTVVSGGTSSDGSVEITWDGTAPYTISVSYTDGNGCSALSPTVFSVDVNPRPVPVITGQTVVCAGSEETYTTGSGSGQTDYLWSVSGGTVISGGGTSDPSVEVRWDGSAPYEVSVNYTDANGCTAVGPTQLPVTVNPLPVPSLSGPASVCFGTIHAYSTESGAGLSGYVWNVTGGTVISGGTTSDSFVEVAWDGTAPHEVSVNYQDSNGCTAVSPTVLPVNVIPLPVPSLDGSPLVCELSTQTYSTDSTAGQSNFIWSVTGGTIVSGGTPSDPSADILWDGTAPHQVSVSYTDINGCIASPPANLPVTVNPLPVPVIIGPATTCSGSAEVYTTDSGSGISNYIWSVSGGTILSGGTNSDPDIEILWDGTGPYEVGVNYEDGNGCGAINPTVLSVTLSPRPAGLVFSGATDICEGEDTNLNITVSGGTAPYQVYLSTDGGATLMDSVLVPDNNPFLYNTGPLTASTTFSITGLTDTNGCTLDPASLPGDVTVNVNPLGDVSFTIPNSSGDSGDELVMPVTVQGFSDIISTAFSLTWDQNIISFIAIEDIAGLSGLDLTKFNLVDSSTLTLQWTELSAVGQSLPDDAILFSVRFGLTGPDCFSSVIAFGGDPVSISVVDANSCTPNLNFNNGSINVGGSGVSRTPVMAYADTVNCLLDPVPELLVSGVNVQWYADPALTNLIGTGDAFTPVLDNSLASDTVFYATQIIGSCSESLPDSVRVVYTDIPSNLPVPGQRRYDICLNDAPPTLAATGTNIRWYTDSGLNNLVGTGNTFTPGPGELDTSVADTTYFYMTLSNTCGDGPYDSTAVHVKTRSYPPVVNALTTVCVGDPAPVLTAIGNNIIWYTDSALTLIAATGNSFMPDSTLLDMNASGITTFYVTQDDGCGESLGAAVEVSVIWCVTDCSAITTDVNTTLPTCNLDNGVIQLTASGGTGYYTYQLIKPDSLVLSNKTGSFTGLEGGVYQYEIVDDTAACITDRDTVMLIDPTNIVATADTASFVNSLCYGEPLGRAIINVSGGSDPYEYSINGNTWVSFNSGEYINNLPPLGTYIILVRENAGSVCYEQVTVTINNDYPPLDYTYSVTDASCSDDDGRITIDEITGGLEPYEISYDGGAFETVDLNDLPVFDNLSAGVKNIRIQDVNGCILEDPNVVVGSPGSLVVNIQVFPPTCDGNGMDGRVTLFADTTANLHQPPYAFGLAGVDTPETDVLMMPLPPNSIVSIDTLRAGGYYVLLESSTGCGSRRDFAISGGPTAISFDLADIRGIPCKGDGTGSVVVDNVTGDPTQIYLLQLLSIPSLDVVYTANLVQDDFVGGYTIDGTVTDQITQGEYQIILSQNQSGCNLSDTSIVFEIIEPEALLDFEITEVAPSFEDVPSGTVTIRIVESGGDPYETKIDNRDWEIVERQGTEYIYTHEELFSGVHEIFVVDDYGCEVVREVTIESDNTLYIPNVFTPNNDAHNDFFYIRNLPDPGSGTVLVISNRWGRTVFESNDYNYNNLWDGGDNPDGVYYYRLDVPDNGSYKGWVEIWRGGKR